MTYPLKNLRVLREEMQNREWVLTCFRFPYNSINYFVFVKRYIPESIAPKYALVELCFADCADLNRVLVTPVNSKSLMVDTKTFREFFRIKWAPNLGELLEQFASRLGEHIPTQLPKKLDEMERSALLHRLHISDSEDPLKIYCIGVRRNPDRSDETPGQRSDFNSQKTQILRPELWEKVGSDPGLSFLYSSESDQEKSDAEILAELTKRQGMDDRS